MVEENKIDIFVNVLSLTKDERTNKYSLEIKVIIDMTNNPIFKSLWIGRERVDTFWGKEEKMCSSIFRYKIQELEANSVHELQDCYLEYLEWLKREVKKHFLGFGNEKFSFENAHLSYLDGCFEENFEEVEFEIKRD